MDEIEASAVLRAKREEADISRAEIADKLNVSEETIRKLEDGEHDQLRGRVFVRGYIRYYAKLLDVNIAELFDDEDEVVIDAPDDLDYTQNETALRYMRIWGSIIVLAAAGFVVYSWWLESKPPLLVPITPPATDAVAPSLSEPDTTLESPTMNRVRSAPETWPDEETQTPSQTQWTAPATPTESSASPEPTESFASPEPTESTATEAPPATSTSAQTILDNFIEVKLETGEYESWVQITDADGDVLFERLITPFAEARVYGTAPFNFRIGYVEDVTLIIDGEIYPFTQYESRGMAIFVAP